MGIKGTRGIMKLVAFILVTVAFVFSMWLVNGGNHIVAGAIIAGFFGYYLAAFIGMMCGGEIDSDTAKNWALYGCIALFGACFEIVLHHGGSSNDTPAMMRLICGIVCLPASIFCFLDAFFS